MKFSGKSRCAARRSCWDGSNGARIGFMRKRPFFELHGSQAATILFQQVWPPSTEAVTEEDVEPGEGHPCWRPHVLTQRDHRRQPHRCRRAPDDLVVFGDHDVASLHDRPHGVCPVEQRQRTVELEAGANFLDLHVVKKIDMIRLARFELAAPASRKQCSNRAELHSEITAC